MNLFKSCPENINFGVEFKNNVISSMEERDPFENEYFWKTSQKGEVVDPDLQKSSNKIFYECSKAAEPSWSTWSALGLSKPTQTNDSAK